jgi:hypothetical protein
MKRILFIIIAMFFIVSLTYSTTAGRIDTALLVGKRFVSATLTPTQDTLDVFFSLNNRQYSWYSITIVSTGTDTLNFYTLAWDSSGWEQSGLTDIYSGSNITSISASTTRKTYSSIHPQPYKMRIISTSGDASTTTIVVSGETGIQPFGTAIGGSSVFVVSTDTVRTITRPTWLSWSATDSMSRPLDASIATPYSINDVYTSTTTASAMTLFAFKNVANANGGFFKVNIARARTDTAISATIWCMLTLFKDSSLVNHVADNTPSTMIGTGTAFKNVIGEIIFSLQSTGAGSGSTTSWDVEYPTNLQGYCASGSKDIYGKLTWLTAVTYSNGGKIWFELEGQKEVLPQ